MKTALLFGSTGLVGGHVLNQLIQNNNYSKIKIFVRSSTEINDSKIEVIKIDFNNLDKHAEDIKGHECFFCIGTTKKNSPNKEDYQKVELELPKKIAQICKKNSIKSYVFVSSGFANSKNKGEYLRFKGLVEEELKRLDFDNLGILRPSFLLGERKQFRIAEKIGIPIFKLLTPLFIGPLKKMRPIHANTVAKAMSNIVKKNLDQVTYESDEIVKIS